MWVLFVIVITAILVIHSRREDRNNTLEGRFSYSVKKESNKQVGNKRGKKILSMISNFTKETRENEITNKNKKIKNESSTIIVKAEEKEQNSISEYPDNVNNIDQSIGNGQENSGLASSDNLIEKDIKEMKSQESNDEIISGLQIEEDSGIDEDEVNLSGNIFYDNRQLYASDNGWAHFFSYNAERLRFESRKNNIMQTCGDYPLESIISVELTEGESLRYELYRLFLDFHTDTGLSRLYISDRKLINENVDFLEDIVWKINNEIILSQKEYYFK